MVLVSGLLSGCSLFSIGYQPKTLIWMQRQNNEAKLKNDNNKVHFSTRKIFSMRIRYFLDGCRGSRCMASVGRNQPNLWSEDDVASEHFWLTFIREGLGFLKSLFVFLAEQPSQLKYIEWPSFQNTLKTATLTLVLVALLIVALSSVDASLSYLLAVYLRKSSG